MRRLVQILAALALMAQTAPETLPEVSVVNAQPKRVADTLPFGHSRVGKYAWAFRPNTVPPNGEPQRVVLLFHGSPSTPRFIIKRFEKAAEQHRTILLAVGSKFETWDLIEAFRPVGRGPMSWKVPQRPKFGVDIPRIEQSLRLFFDQVPTDRNHLVVAGFSDGASMALSFGLANHQLFRGIISMSPGVVLLPRTGLMSQEIYILHGTRDQTLSYEVTKNDIAGLLEKVGYKPVLLPFDGDHVVHGPTFHDAMERIFGPSPETAAEPAPSP